MLFDSSWNSSASDLPTGIICIDTSHALAWNEAKKSTDLSSTLSQVEKGKFSCLEVGFVALLPSKIIN